MMLSDVRTRLKMLGKSQADLARYLELDPSSLTKTLDGERRVQPAEAVKIQSYFGEKLELDVAATAPASSRRSATPQKIPVYGYAAEDGEGIAYGEGSVLDRLDAPPHWNGEGAIVYVRLRDDLMAPRYFSGEIVTVKLDVPPATRQDCMIELRSGAVLIRTYQGERDGQVFLEQYGADPKTYGIIATDVLKKHAVWRPGMV